MHTQMYPGCYPVGAFIVDSKQSLGPLVSHLRQYGKKSDDNGGSRLKSGRNVTEFDATSVVQYCGDNEQKEDSSVCAHPLSRTHIVISELYDGEEANTALTQECYEVLTLNHASSPSSSVQQHVAEHVEPFLASLQNQGQSAAPKTYMAVHVTGAFSAQELVDLMTVKEEASSAGGGKNTARPAPPVAYISQLRVYSRACVPQGPQSLPAPLQQLRRLALTPAAASSSSNVENNNNNNTSSSQHPFTFSELFGGIGMFRLGLERAGGRAMFSVEFAAWAQAVYKANFHNEGNDNSVPLAGDITEIPSAFFPTHDVLTAGFPCQSFAKAAAGSGSGSMLRGLHHAKGWLFYEVVRALRVSRPRAFLLENVANLADVEEGEQLQEILTHLRNPCLGEVRANVTSSAAGVRYAVHYEVIDGAVATAQTRRRVYFIGVRLDDDECAQYESNKESHTNPSSAESKKTASIVSRLHAHLAELSAQTQTATVRDTLMPWTAAQFEPWRLTPTQWAAVRRSRTYRQNPLWRVVNVGGKARTLMGSYRTSFQLYSEFVPYPDCDRTYTEGTLPCALGREEEDHHHNNNNGDEAAADKETDGNEEEEAPLRFLTVRECARLQGIPDSFDLLVKEEEATFVVSAQQQRRCIVPGAAYKLVGNAVNPIVIACLGRAMAEELF